MHPNNVIEDIYYSMPNTSPHKEPLGKFMIMVREVEGARRWLRGNIEFDASKPGLIAIPKSPEKLSEKKYVKPKTFLQFCAKELNRVNEETSQEIERIAYSIGDLGVFKKPTITHRIVEGDEVIELYGCFHSCFVGYDGKGKPLVRFYSENPEKIKMIVAYKNNVPVGRSLLWYGDDNRVFRDREYSSRTDITRYLEELTKKHNWLTRETPESITVSNLRLTDVVPPYLDHAKRISVDKDARTVTVIKGDSGWSYFRSHMLPEDVEIGNNR